MKFLYFKDFIDKLNQDGFLSEYAAASQIISYFHEINLQMSYWFKKPNLWYVGITKDPAKRKKEHIYNLSKKNVNHFFAIKTNSKEIAQNAEKFLHNEGFSIYYSELPISQNILEGLGDSSILEGVTSETKYLYIFRINRK